MFSVALLFVYSSFTAIIVALLQSTTNSVQSIADLMNPAFGIGIQDTPYARYYFARHTEPIQKQFYETRVVPANAPSAYINATDGIERLRQGMFAFHMETGPAYLQIAKTFMEHEKCGLVVIKFFDMGDTWHAFQKRSPYKEMLKVK